MRRPIAARDAGWAKNTARALARMGVSPNAVSLASVGCALLAAACLANVPGQTPPIQCVLLVGAALCIQLRLLCNLFDGMLAVEWNRKSHLGPLFNDLPDRPADVLVLVGCGTCGGPAWMPLAGWVAATLALLTAYTRVLGVAMGAGEYFTGPMAKQHRMAAATIACGLAAVEALLHWPPRVMAGMLVLVTLGCVVTIARRLQLIARDLKRLEVDAASTAKSEGTA